MTQHDRKSVILLVAVVVLAVVLIWPQHKVQFPKTGIPITSSDIVQTPTVFRSNLGLKFKYLPDQNGDGIPDVFISQIGPVVKLAEVHNKQTQQMTVFTKPASQDLQTAIEKQILASASNKKCLIQTENDSQRANIVRAELNSDQCPGQFMGQEPNKYFWTDLQHPTSFFFMDVQGRPFAADEHSDWTQTIQLGL
ncbi:MAG: hypothetical protein ABI643_00785 [Candidatus Doudnabacteria bacterium]